MATAAASLGATSRGLGRTEERIVGKFVHFNVWYSPLRDKVSRSSDGYAADWEIRVFGRLSERERLRGERLTAEAGKRRLRPGPQKPARPSRFGALLADSRRK